MKPSNEQRLTRTRRRAFAVPFVITIVAAGAACGADTASVPVGDRTDTTDNVISNPAEPEAEPEAERVVTISNPAEPEPEREVTISNPAEPEREPGDEALPDELLVISNPAPPEDG